MGIFLAIVCPVDRADFSLTHEEKRERVVDVDKVQFLCSKKVRSEFLK